MRDDAAALVRRNKAAFKKQFPAVLEELARIAEVQSVPVVENGRFENIRVGDAFLYPAPAVEWTAGQLDGFSAEASRVVFDNAAHCNPSEISLRLYAALKQELLKGRFGKTAAAPLVDSGFAFIFGVGLGHHVAELVAKLKVRHFIFIEPVPEFLLHSMAVVDWSAVFRKAKAKGAKIDFVICAEPAQIVRAIETILIVNGATFIDGSFFYYHYYSWALVEANSLLSVALKHHIYTTGFYEDECLMMANASGNILSHSFRICEPIAMVENDVPVFIVGSGPSLDNDIEEIKRWRSKVVLISCGTTLSILLRHGIRPDIHIEIENGPRTPQHIALAIEKYGPLDDVVFAASITVSPQAVAQFREAWLFFRVGLSPAFVFRGPHAVLAGSEPSVANGAFAVASASGFRQIYLFGVDCGYREGSGAHHAKESIYYHDKSFDLGDVTASYDRVLPGNFGGKFRANYVYDMTARGLIELKRHFRDIQFYNCSDGARIDGALPKAAASIDLSASRADPKAVLSRIGQRWTAYAPREMLRGVDSGALVRGCSLYAEGVDGLCESADKFGSFFDLHGAYRRMVADLPDECRAVLAIVAPSVESMLRMAAFYGTRLFTVRQRKALMAFSLQEMRPLVREMRDGAVAILEKLHD